VHGRLVTADALHTQTAFAQGVLDQGGVLCVKGNQPTLYADIALAFADSATCCSPTVSTTDRPRGRIDVRSLRTTTGLNRYSTSIPPLGQVAELTRTVTRKGHTTREVVFLVTSRAPARGSPAQLLAWIRGHWSIEARHHVRDGSFGEDQSRLRTGHAPQVMAALRNLCITLLHCTKHHQISQARRSFAYHPAQALVLLFPRRRSP
jgi:predicted transposase YbfD/YdcC